MAKRSMMDQFHELKDANPGTILFFRMGDFYELFHEDAEVGSNVLGLALTSRDKNAEKPIPMAGFPWHQLEENLRLMLRSGHKVTVAEQEEELREGAKLLERVVTRIYTPGSLYEESLIGSDSSALLCSVLVDQDTAALAMIDASTGQAWAVAFEGDGKWASIHDEIMRWNPSELVLTPQDAERSELLHLLGLLDSVIVSQHSVQPKRASQRLKAMLEVNDLGHLDLGQSPEALQATALAADYLASVHRHDDIAIRDVEIQETSEGMVLDQTTLRNLEITQTLAGEYEGSLLWAMNKCRTAMGRRCLKSWLLRPLSNTDAIQARHASVGALMRSSKRLDLLRDSLKGMLDLERLSTQLKYNRSNARDLLATANAIERLPAIQRLSIETEDGLLCHLVEHLDSLSDVAEEIHRTLADEVPLGLRDGGLIRAGVDEELDRYRNASNQGHTWFSDLEQSLRKELNIPSLKVRMNRQIGWFIEVTSTHADKVPEDWTRKQQMTNGNRYVTDELREQDDLLLTAESKSKAIEYGLFCSLRDRVRKHANRLAQIASKVAAIDVLQCFASTSRQRSWVKPTIAEGRKMVLSQARHPVLEAQQGFVPNDVVMDDKRHFLLITGPNMGGKSTYLRTVALVSILAQSGCFVPAEKARIGLIDRIFTRVGASDDLRRGRSTFMMEMIEVAHILRRATPNSLLLLDEIGRGTSTFDGLSIAWAVTEDVCNRIGARSLFATHYHQLVGLESEVNGLANVHVQVAQNDGTLRFLHTVADGPCDESYGVQVAALAGLPRSVVERATDLLAFLERQAQGAKAGRDGAPGTREQGQSSLMGYFAAAAMQTNESNGPSMSDAQENVLSTLSSINLDDLSPRDAFALIERMQHQLGDE
ncbi:MAG: DNA mismatch repair protein MutS [Candidatus Poseidoniales archaeon]|nr:DNA mismatch repair protein MutS [Candidatus Poseidoniales archaeon]